VSWQVSVLAVPTLLAMAVALALAGYTATVYWNGRRDSLVAIFFWITVAVVVWTGFSVLKLLHTDPAVKLLFYRLLHVGAATLPPLLFLFVVAYTDRVRWLRPSTVGGVLVLPAVYLLFLVVDPGGVIVAGTERIENGLVVLRVLDGPGVLFLALYSVGFLVASLGLVLVETRRVGSAYYPQAALIVVGVAVPAVFGLLTSVGIPPFTDDRVNLVPTSAAVSAGALGVLLFRYRLFDLPPLAYATAMKYSPDALFVLGEGERVVHANDHGDELIDELGGQVGSSLSDALPEFDPRTTPGELIEIESGSGRPTYHRVFAEPLNRGGRRVGWVVVLRDETRQQRQQTALEQHNDRMELFASTVSHDLRNPLNVAKLRLEQVREEPSDEQLDAIESAHARMEEIIDQLLMLAREGKQIDDRQRVRLADIVRLAWETVSTPDAELTVGVDRKILADPTMLQHVFENLFRNSVEHGTDARLGSDDGSDESDLTVRVEVGELDGGFYVADDGPGIPEEERAAVLDSGYSTSSEGTGLGLQIVQRIVDAHGWDLAVTEGENGGARFEVRGVEEPNS